MTTADQKPAVVLIDDSIDVHRLLQARLKSEPISLHCFTSGVDGLRECPDLKPAAVFLDLDMPDIDGFAVLRAFKDDPTLHNVPILVLSGLQGSEDKVTAFELGATDYVTKPFDIAELRARLRAALRLSHLLKLLDERANVDGLTGLGNRAQFDKSLEVAISEASRYGRPLSLAMLDIDHFKRINDTYGHMAGDEVLMGFAEQLQSACRSSDIPCRYGGEEMSLIMPETGPEQAAEFADRIRATLAETVWARHPEHTVTVSIGILGADGKTAHTATPEQWVERADAALYEAKRGGRNRVVVKDLGAGAPRIVKDAG